MLLQVSEYSIGEMKNWLHFITSAVNEFFVPFNLFIDEQH